MTELSIGSMVVRLLLALVAGAIVGCERETRGRPAGLRTTILACLAAAVAMIVAEQLAFWTASLGQNGLVHIDPARVASGVLTGIGFLGAGTIIRHGVTIFGVTTAASLWFVTVLGLAFGSGEFALGFIGVGLAWGTLYGLPLCEKYIRSEGYCTLTVRARLEVLNEQELRTEVEAIGPSVLAMKAAYDLEKGEKTLTCEMRVRDARSFQLAGRILSALKDRPGVLHVECG
jgi:putative Mg2+ transporter-C (MgtC) family protein